MIRAPGAPAAPSEVEKRGRQSPRCRHSTPEETPAKSKVPHTCRGSTGSRSSRRPTDVTCSKAAPVTILGKPNSITYETDSANVRQLLWNCISCLAPKTASRPGMTLLHAELLLPRESIIRKPRGAECRSDGQHHLGAVVIVSGPASARNLRPHPASGLWKQAPAQNNKERTPRRPKNDTKNLAPWCHTDLSENARCFATGRITHFVASRDACSRDP